MTAAPLEPAQLILASASPRRAALLDQLKLRYLVRPVNIDETPHPGETPQAYVERLASAKAKAGATIAASVEKAMPVLGADTTVAVDGVTLGKPEDETVAFEMLLALSGRPHEVLTAVAVARGRRLETRLSRSVVHFRVISRPEAEAYARSTEGSDKAGGYGIQGIGGIFASRIEGSFSGIVGLPIAETEALLLAFDVDTWQYRR
jgi:septum formation protein